MTITRKLYWIARALEACRFVMFMCSGVLVILAVNGRLEPWERAGCVGLALGIFAYLMLTRHRQ